ncbi:MAG: TetR/AcrR family transcriptional regulator [Saprospiraceae bacterium]|jgi:AcrR family transcriptional regulator|nr:TetR/AcrR family transcriptional regulator [Saprospiraceae bacterium]
MHLELSTFSGSIKGGIFLKDPATSTLGWSILTNSIEIIDEVGFEQFTFRKLATKMQSTEASIYRYFENKHKLLLYLSSWYWSWAEYNLALRNANLSSPQQKLLHAIEQLASPTKVNYNGMDIGRLYQVIVRESSKAYLIKEVDQLNRNGLFYNYKKFVSILSQLILEIKSGYAYPHMLVTTIIEGIHHQRFFSEHLPSLTDMPLEGESLADFYYSLAMAAINQKTDDLHTSSTILQTLTAE